MVFLDDSETSLQALALHLVQERLHSSSIVPPITTDVRSQPAVFASFLKLL